MGCTSPTSTGPDGIRQLVPATTAPTAIAALWATLSKQEKLVVELTQEGAGDAIDELAVDGPEGKPWHPSPSPCTHAHHTFPLPTDPGRNGDGPSANDTIRFRARRYPSLEPDGRRWLVHAQAQQLQRF
jgi:hypothetical protein